MITALILTLLVVFMTGYLLQTTIKPRKYPPGPRWLPFVGTTNIVQKLIKIYGSQWKAFSHLAKEYSTSVLGLKLGSELVVVVYGETLIRHALTEPEYEGRPNSFFIRLRCFGKRMGITSTDGPLWRVFRQFTLKHLKNVGFGKTAMEQEIQNEMNKIVQFIQNNNKPISPKTILAIAVMNVMWKYVAGESIATDRLSLLLELVTARSKAFSMAGGLLNQFPWCRFFFPEASGYTLITRINHQISDIIEDAIKKHKNNLQEPEAKDFIYAFLQHMGEDKEIFTDEQLKVICLDMFIAGSQTTSNQLEFALLAALRHPHIQDKVYEEIRRVIGDETPCWMDNNKLTYTSAFLLEVQRCYAIVPLIGPRRLLRDTVLDGYFIPKNTTVLMSVGDLNFDPAVYSDPHEFRPERFIDETGALKHTELYSFGLGRRRCPGDSLARSFIFITFVGILQKFRIQCVNGVLPSDEPVIGLISTPRPFSAVFVKRQ